MTNEMGDFVTMSNTAFRCVTNKIIPFVILCFGVHTKIPNETAFFVKLISRDYWFVYFLYCIKSDHSPRWGGFYGWWFGLYTKKQICCFYLVILTFPPAKKMTHLQIAFLPPKKKAKKRDLQKRYFLKMTLYYIIIYYYYYYITHNILHLFVIFIFVRRSIYTAFSPCVTPKH